MKCLSVRMQKIGEWSIELAVVFIGAGDSLIVRLCVVYPAHDTAAEHELAKCNYAACTRTLHTCIDIMT